MGKIVHIMFIILIYKNAIFAQRENIMHREGIVDSKVAWMRTNKKMLLIKSNEWIYTLERQKICTLDLEPRVLYNRAQLVEINTEKSRKNEGALKLEYCKVANSSLSRLVTRFQIFRSLKKGKFDAYVLWPLAQKFQNWIVLRPV